MAEALARLSCAAEQFAAEPDPEEVRGGQPQRKFLSIDGGNVQDAIYQSSATVDLLQQITYARFAPTGQRGTYTYYQRAGDHLALHRDVETCDLALITSLYSTNPACNSAGLFCAYPDRIEEPLSHIGRTLNEGAVFVDLQPGQTLALLGGLVPHRVTPVAPGQVKIVSVLCFQLVGGFL